ncbi:MAG TPA: RluA family pseudouridine synthase [Verrucomicrobiae bacterium]
MNTTLPSRLFEVIHEDDEFLVINKPADLVCHPTKGDIYSSLISRVRIHLGESINPHLINRLDRETSGLVLVAKTDEAAKQLRKKWESREVRKIYQTIVHGHVATDGGLIDAPLGKDEKSIVAIKDCVRPDGANSQTVYKVLKRFTRTEGDFSLLEVELLTGRKHQIRIHLSHIGHPIVGDKIYGGDETLYLALVESRLTEEQRQRLILHCQALHAGELRFQWQGEERIYRAEPENWFRDFIV